MLMSLIADNRRRIIATDGVFSMDGDVAPLNEICDLADKYKALVFIDEAHATGLSELLSCNLFTNSCFLCAVITFLLQAALFELSASRFVW